MPAVGPGNITKNIAGTSSATQVAAATYLSLSVSTGKSGNDLINIMKANATNTVGRQGSFNKKITSATSATTAAPVNNTAAADAAAKAAADAAAKAAARAVLQAEVNAAIAVAETQYQNELKIAQDKLAATKSLWLAKLNG